MSIYAHSVLTVVDESSRKKPWALELDNKDLNSYSSP